MMTTREDIVQAVVAIAERAALALPNARTVRTPTKPELLEHEQTLFVVPEADTLETLEVIGRCKPFYITDRIPVEVAVAASESDLALFYGNAVRAIDAELEADVTLRSLVKGFTWSSDGTQTDSPDGASPERSGEISIVTEFESASRLAV